MSQENLNPHFESNLRSRQRLGKVWQTVFIITTIIGVVFLALLLYNITNQGFGYVAVETKVAPETLVTDGQQLSQLEKGDLIKILKANLNEARINNLVSEKSLDERSQEDLYQLVYMEVLKPTITKTWTLVESLTHREAIFNEVAEDFPTASLEFKSWLNADFISSQQSSKPLLAGVRTALLGSVWSILITIAVAFPIGVGAAIYLEEYAVDNRLNRVIQTNINNLAGVPSIIYGMLGLAIFVRTLALLTSGAIFGLAEGDSINGRTLLSAGLTLALLILPLIIINTQEAIRAVPDSLRQASYGIGATQWQTIWHHVLPQAIPGILTGTILAISRAIGETAPLVVVGAATYITFDPKGIFSKFTTLPIQIYQWSARPQAEFQHLAAAAILVLLLLLLTLNSIAIILRNRYQK